MSRQITTALARQLVKNFLEKKRGHNLPADDTYSVWFDKETILQLFNLPTDTDTKDVNGIRFYFAAYGDVETPEIGQDALGKMTLVGVSTKNEDKENKDIITTPDAKPAYDFSAPTKEAKEMNLGQLCPPPKLLSEDANGMVTKEMY